MRDIRLFDVAAREVMEARDWYEKESTGLGGRFIDELEHQLERIMANPGQFPFILEDVRRAKLRIFPYGIFFRERGNLVFVIACFHASRDPLTWQRRL